MKKSWVKIFALSLLLIFSFARHLEGTPSRAKVHVITHSHMDAGWLFTYDDYFEWKVEEILRSVT